MVMKISGACNSKDYLIPLIKEVKTKNYTYEVEYTNSELLEVDRYI